MNLKKSYIQEPDEYLNLDPIEEANDSFTLSEEINGMEEIQTEDAQNAYEYGTGNIESCQNQEVS